MPTSEIKMFPRKKYVSGSPVGTKQFGNKHFWVEIRVGGVGGWVEVSTTEIKN